MTADPLPPDGSLELPARAGFLRNAAHMLSSQLFTWVLATFASIIVPRYLGPDLSGQVRVAASLWTIGSIVVAFGFTSVLQLEIAKDRAAGLRLVGPVMVVRTTIFVAVSGVLAAYLWADGADRTLWILAALFGGAILVGTWSDAIGSAFIGLESMSATALIGALTRFVATLATVAVVVLRGGVYLIVGVGVGAAAYGLVHISWRFRKIARVSLRHWPVSARTLVRTGLPFAAVAGALSLYQQIDIIVISQLASKTEVGWYGASDTLFGSLLFPATLIAAVLFPTLGRLASSDLPALERLVERAFLALLVIGVPIGLGTTLVGPRFAPLLYGRQYDGTGDVLVAIGPVIILTFGTILLGTVATAKGRSAFWAVVLVISAGLTIPLDLWLVPWMRDRYHNGAIGGALAYIVTEFVQLVIGLVAIAPYLCTRATAIRLVKVAFAGGAMFGVGLLVRDQPMVLVIVECAAVYVLAVFVLRVPNSSELNVIRSAFGRVTERLRGTRGTDR